jgi:hypothetical protein
MRMKTEMVWAHVHIQLWVSKGISETVRVISLASFTEKQNSYISHHKIRPKKYSMFKSVVQVTASDNSNY